MSDDDNEISETFKALKQHSQERRANNRDQSARLLQEAGIEFQERNAGAHLVCHIHGTIYDFWPGTGLFINRTTQRRGRGVRHLLTLHRNPS